jgi:hypothetical protein
MATLAYGAVGTITKTKIHMLQRSGAPVYPSPTSRADCELKMAALIEIDKVRTSNKLTYKCFEIDQAVVTFVPSSTTNRAPTLSGTPPSAVTAAVAYSFMPTAVDPDGDALTFSIANKPSWATFTASTGRLYGTPTTAHVGLYSNITISASDGKTTTTMPAFALTVSPAAPPAETWTICANEYGRCSFTGARRVRYGTGATWVIQEFTDGVDCINASFSSDPAPGATKRCELGSGVAQPPPSGRVTLSWTPPTQNVDGTALTNLAGYRIYYGTSAAALTRTEQVSNASITTYPVEGLSPATYYFAVRSYTSDGIESANSNIASKTVQ